MPSKSMIREQVDRSGSETDRPSEDLDWKAQMDVDRPVRPPGKAPRSEAESSYGRRINAMHQERLSVRAYSEQALDLDEYGASTVDASVQRVH